MLLGVDIGIKNIAYIFTCDGFIRYDYWSHSRKLQDVANRIVKNLNGGKPDIIVITGSSLRNGLADILRSLDFSIISITSRIAQEEAVKKLYSNCEKLNLLSLGASGYSLLTKDGRKFIFHSNDRCSSGTGEGIEAFCAELKVGENILTVEEACILARNASVDFRINARCSVMSKSDKVHLTNRGVPASQVLKAFFESIGRNISGFLEQYKVDGPVYLIGGVANNPIIASLINLEAKIVSRKDFFEAEGAAQVAHKMLSEQSYLEVFSKTSLSKSELSRNLSPLVDYSNLVKKYEDESVSGESGVKEVEGPKIIAFDAGSTGTKVAVVNIKSKAVIYSNYEPTGGNPVDAVKCLIKRMSAEYTLSVSAIVVTGSGRDTLAEVLQAVFPNLTNYIFVENEVLAHVAAACAFDPDKGKDLTYIDIGGQDSKYGRVIDGQIVDQALNHACSAGTGSFLEELGRQFNINIVKLGKMALCATQPLDLGERCTVFFSSNALSAFGNGISLENIFAGAYYSVAQNYIRGLASGREIGGTVILQGTPALNEALGDALAALIGKNIIIPLNPGIAGARGAALRVINNFSERLANQKESFDVQLLLDAKVISHKQITCDNRKCGNLCCLDKTVVSVSNKLYPILTGGSCELHTKITNLHKLPQGAPNAFVARDNLMSNFVNDVSLIPELHDKVIGIPLALGYVRFMPFFVTFFRALGFKVKVLQPQYDSLDKGNNLCGSSEMCVPMKLVYGLDYSGIDILFLTKIIAVSVASSDSNNPCCTCPFVQGMPDMLRAKLPGNVDVIDQTLSLKNGFDKNSFIMIGARLGRHQEQTEQAFKYALMGYSDYREKLLGIGRRVIEYAREHNLPVILILGRPYLIYGKLNSGIPNEIQSTGALALPVECYPYLVDHKTYWSYWAESQINLASVAGLRKQRGIYPLWITCFNCGPDSFNEHFLRELAVGPYTMLQVDGHEGSAGFKTRVEAFVECCRSDRVRSDDSAKTDKQGPDIRIFRKDSAGLRSAKLLLLPMGDNRLLAAAMRACGIDAEALPPINVESYALGRYRCTGKECAPCMAVVGSILQYLRLEKDSRCNIFLPTAEGPCRFGMYFPLVKLLLKQEGYNDTVGLCALSSENGYEGQKLGLNKIERLKLWAAICITDLLKQMLYFTRPVEQHSGESLMIYNYFLLKIADYLKQCTSNSLTDVLRIWGLPNLLSAATNTFKGVAVDEQKASQIVNVALAGEIYVRNDDYLNGGIVAELEGRGLRAILAPIGEWIDYVSLKEPWKDGMVRSHIRTRLYNICASKFGWPAQHSIDDILQEGMPYINNNIPNGEAILSIGAPLLQYRKGEVKGAVIVGPVSCMPTRIAGYHLSAINLPTLFIYVDGNSPLNYDELDSFAYQMHQVR